MSDDSPSIGDPFGQIADDFVAAYRAGQRPSVEDFARRYPDHADEIREILPALVLMEKAKAHDPAAAAPTAEAASPPLRQLGDYQILREVGRGGMGVVYEAQQLSLGRHVAIKVLPSHALLDARQLGRFQREARSAARLHHTNIVPVFGVGEQNGLHYYVMQFISGLGLDVVLDELRRLRQPQGRRAATQAGALGQRTNVTRDASAVACGLLSGDFHRAQPAGALTTGPGVGEPVGDGPARSVDASATIRLPGQAETSTLSESGNQYWQSVARVGMQVADALAHAASQGILHRDIKPSNLLLDETGNVWVTDFGLAKAQSDGDNLTHTGDIIGTMRYMAPERFSGQGDLRSDVYSLGLTLYEMLVMRPAFDETDRNKLIKQVMHDEPPRPRRLNPAVPRDLETVVLKAIARDPGHRYQTPAEMAEDLKRFVEDRPVKARRVTETEKFVRWCRRNPLPASLLAGIVLVFLAGFAGVAWQWRVAENAWVDEESQRNRAERLRESAETARDEAKGARNASARQAAGLLFDRGIEDARAGEPARALHLFVQALRALPADDPEATALHRSIRTNLTAWASTVPVLEHLFANAPRFNDIAYAPDGEAIAMAVGPDEIQCFRTSTGQPIGPALKIPFGTGSALKYAADGGSLWVASPGRARAGGPWALHRLDPLTGRPLQLPIPSAGPIERLLVAPDGRYLVGAILGLHPEDRGPEADASGTRKWRTAVIVVWEAASGRVVRQVDVNAESEFANAQNSPDMYMSLSADGKSVTAWVQRGTNHYQAATFTLNGNEPVLHPELPALAAKGAGMLHFQHHMQTALTIKDGQLHRWTATRPSGLGLGVPTPFRSMEEGAAADGRSVISAFDGRVFDTGAWPPRPSGVRFAYPGGWSRSVTETADSPDGRFTITWDWQGGDGRLWRLPRSHSRPALAPGELARRADVENISNDALFDSGATRAVLWSHRRAWAQRADDVHSVRIVDLTTGAIRATSLRHGKLVREAAITPDGRYFATGSFDASARVWESATGRPAGPPLTHTNYVATVAFSPDGNTLAAGDFGPRGLVKFWDWRTGKESRPPLELDDVVLNVSFSADGRYLAVIKSNDWSNHPELMVWEVASGTMVTRVSYTCPNSLVTEKPRFRPDDQAVMARDANGVLRLWEIPSAPGTAAGTPAQPGGKVLGERPLDGDGVTHFSPDGSVIAASANLGVRLFDAQTLAPLAGGYLQHPDRINALAFSPTGAFLLTAHETGSAQLWDVATRKPVGPPAVLLGPIRAVAFTPDGKMCLCVAADGTVRRWPVPALLAEPDLDRLSDRIALLTGQRMDENQGLDSVPSDDWRSLRARLVGEGSTALAPPPLDADWHDRVAADAEQDGDADGAKWHLDRLAQQRPNDWTIPARLGRVFAATGRPNEAAAAYNRAARLVGSPQELAGWLRAAAGDAEAFRHNDVALWNLDRALALTPDDWTLSSARALLLHQARQPKRVAADLDAVIRRGPAEVATLLRLAEAAGDLNDWRRAADLLAPLTHLPNVSTQARYYQAIAALKVGDRAGYQAACAAVAAQVPPVGPQLSGGNAYDAAMMFAPGSEATASWTGPLAWINHSMARLRVYEKAHPERKESLRREWHLFFSLRAALLYRAGRSEEAIQSIREALRYHAKGGDYQNWLYLALAEHRLGQTKAAQDAAAKARTALAAQTPTDIWERAEMELLTAELAAALPPLTR